jgi:hypothetical protein
MSLRISAIVGFRISFVTGEFGVVGTSVLAPRVESIRVQPGTAEFGVKIGPARTSVAVGVLRSVGLGPGAPELGMEAAAAGPAGLGVRTVATARTSSYRHLTLALSGAKPTLVPVRRSSSALLRRPDQSQVRLMTPHLITPLFVHGLITTSEPPARSGKYCTTVMD